MGVLSALGIVRRQADVSEGITAGIFTGAATDPTRMPFASPWSTSQLERWAYQDMFGKLPQGTRASAMAIPAMFRGRNLVCTSIGKLPLVEMTIDVPAPAQPHWINHTGDGSTPQHRMVWTVDDLIWYGLSLWRRNDPGTPFETRQRINQDDWEINFDRREILINGQAMAPEEVILFTGFHEGVLCAGRESILDTKLLYRNVRQRIANPVPQLDLHQTAGADLTDPEIDALIDRWVVARNNPNGGVGYTSKFVEAKPLGADADAALMIEARNAAAVDSARLIGVTASRVDATAPKASLNYETNEGRNEEFLDFDLDLYLVPVLARLSLDDVCIPGNRIAADETQFTTLTPSPTGPALED